MYQLQKIKTEIAHTINELMGIEVVEANNLLHPPEDDMGDLSLPCFVLAKQSGENPAKIAEKLVSLFAKLINTAKSNIASVTAQGPYFNIFLQKKKFAFAVVKEVLEQKEKYGHNSSGRKQRLLIEFSNVNTHKEYHVGHLRNICYGDSVNKILLANGFDSIPISYVNDFGIHVAKTLWAYEEFYQSKEPDKNKGYFLGQVYARASQEIKTKDHNVDLVRFMMKKIESRQGREYRLWQKTRQWSIDQFAEIYKELGVKFTKTYYESESIEAGRKMVSKLLKKAVLKESEGAVIADLRDHDLDVLVVLRSDGSATYPVADIALAKKKFADFHPDASVYVVDKRQALYFKQLFFILKAIGLKNTMMHLGYDFVKLPSGMMSSRSGNIISYEDLKKSLLTKAREETAKRHKDWSSAKIGTAAQKMAIGAIKFEMLKVAALQAISFDIKKALDFSGFRAGYLQYTCARIKSIVRKSGESLKSLDKIVSAEFHEDLEQKIILRIAKYPQCVLRAGKNFAPADIAKFIFELAQSINDYYHSIPVLQSEPKTRKARLAMLASAEQVIANGLELLGIEVLDEM